MVIRRRTTLDNPPAAMSGLRAWLRADTGTYQDTGRTTAATTDGATVAAWTDLSLNANHVTNGSAGTQPTLRLNVLNGRPVIRFNGTNNRLDFGTLISDTAVTLFAVVVFRGGAGDRALYATNKFATYVSIGSIANRWGGYQGTILDSGVALSVGASYVLSETMRAANDVDLSYNGTVVNSTAGNALDARTGSTLAADPSGVQFGQFDLAELVLYSRALAAAEVARMKWYLARRYAIAVV